MQNVKFTFKFKFFLIESQKIVNTGLSARKHNYAHCIYTSGMAF